MESLSELAATANSAAAKGAESLCVAGDALLKAKRMVAHGEWENWLLKNWRYSIRHAQRLMRAAEVVGRSNADNVLTSISLPDRTETTSMSLLNAGDEELSQHQNGHACPLLERNESDHVDGSGGQPPPYFEEPFEVPFDDPPGPAPAAPPKAPGGDLVPRRPRPAVPPPGLKAEVERKGIDLVLTAASRFSRRMTVWINDTPEGRNFAKLVVGRGLNWIDHRDITVRGRTFGKVFVGLRAVRDLIKKARLPNGSSADRLAELFDEFDPDGGT